MTSCIAHANIAITVSQKPIRVLILDTIHRQLEILSKIMRRQLQNNLFWAIIIHTHNTQTSQCYLEDVVQNELTEGSHAATLWGLSPLLGLQVEETVSPQFCHHFLLIDAKFSAVHLSKLLQGESPAVETWAETNCSLGRAHLKTSTIVRDH